MLKKEGNIMYMLYDNKGKIRLPNPNHGLYVVQNYLIEIGVTPVNQRAPQRVASERMTTHRERTWYGADPGPEKAAHLHYCDYNPQVLRDPWVRHAQPQEPTQETWPGAKITSGQTRLSIRAGTPLIHMELQGLDLRPNSMQDDTPTPSTLSRTTTTKRSVLSSPVPTTLSSTSRIRKQNKDHAIAVQELRQETTTMNDNITTMM